MNSFDIVDEFEIQVASYCGAKYGVAVNCCTSALFLCCRYLSVKQVLLPARTYCSVPCSVIHAGGSVNFEEYDWDGEYRLDPYPIVDSAGKFSRNMYQGDEFRCVSFHWTKILPLGKGGMILHSDDKADEWFRLARYSGRHSCDQFSDPGYALCGWNFYMEPDRAAWGMTLLKNLPSNPPNIRSNNSYPSLLDNPIYKATNDEDRYKLPAPYDPLENWSHKGLDFKAITEEDADAVMEWRNHPTSQVFFNNTITKEGHLEFIANKPKNDYIWIIKESGHSIGMVSLIVNFEEKTAEYGRLLVDPLLRGRFYGDRIEKAIMHHGTQSLGLKLFAVYYENNLPAHRLHMKHGWKVVDRKEDEKGPIVRIEMPD